MWNVIKAQNYQMRGDNLVVYGFLISFFIPVLALFLGGGSLEGINGGLYAITCFMVLPFVFSLLTLILSTRCCGWDMNDKTINYEILSGRSRRDAYWGRVIAAFIWSFAGCLVIAVLPILVVTLIAGWGMNVKFYEIAVSFLLMFFPLFRLLCEYILLTFLLRNSYKGMIIGFVLFDGSLLAGMVLGEVLDFHFPALFSADNILRITEISNYRYEMVNGKEIQVFDFMPDSSLVIPTILVSLVVGILCLLLGSYVFRKNDMD